MATIQIVVNGRTYDLACEEGEAGRLTEIAGEVDRRVGALARSQGQAGEARLLLMACLLIADELAEAKAQLQRPSVSETPRRKLDERLVATIDRLSKRIESIAAHVEAG